MIAKTKNIKSSNIKIKIPNNPSLHTIIHVTVSLTL
ncbi:hypothetical protein XF_0191 [Xylella fastidiosa 9a5c]|uniref:Uncharacterized protein n=1 Tax=Xylella fastidiosa (strain 9a5c) TaxID=160492 RepID=Q9PGV7_XYLFA|nr:hypothetical protein XF_0191 [Xylella fastidiosa 9a5c]